MESFHLAETDSSELADAIASRVARGEVGIIPTETVYGLVCRADSDAARARIYAIKGRDESKPLQVLLPDVKSVESLDIEITRSLLGLASCWPGGLTVVVADRFGAEHGVRIPDHPFALAVLKAYGAPVAATSANPSGVDPVESHATGFANLAEPPDFIVYDTVLPGGTASTVVRLAEDGVYVLRAGAIAPDVLIPLVDPLPVITP